MTPTQSTMTPTQTPHICLNARGSPVIEDTRHKVKQIAIYVTQGNESPLEIQNRFPELSLAQIHAALAYYYDHQAAMDAEIKHDYEEYERLRAENLNSPLHQKLRAMGKIP